MGLGVGEADGEDEIGGEGDAAAVSANTADAASTAAPKDRASLGEAIAPYRMASWDLSRSATLPTCRPAMSVSGHIRIRGRRMRGWTLSCSSMATAAT